MSRPSPPQPLPGPVPLIEAVKDRDRIKTLRAVLRATLGPLRRTPDHCELVETVERVLRETERVEREATDPGA